MAASKSKAENIMGENVGAPLTLHPSLPLTINPPHSPFPLCLRNLLLLQYPSWYVVWKIKFPWVLQRVPECIALVLPVLKPVREKLKKNLEWILESPA